MIGAARSLKDPVRFVVDVGEDGFNAYRLRADGSEELFAASSSMSTFIKVVETIANAHRADDPIRFASAQSAASSTDVL